MINKFSFVSSILLALITSTTFAAPTNFNCPDPASIQSTDFTVPSIWVAPPVAHSAPTVSGIGLGGKEVKEFVGAEATIIDHKRGWVCVYKSAGGLSPTEFEASIAKVVANNPYLKKYLNNVNKAFADAEPFLQKYPQDSALGFVGYVYKR